MFRGGAIRLHGEKRREKQSNNGGEERQMDDANNPVIDLLKSRYAGRAIASDPLSGAVVE